MTGTVFGGSGEEREKEGEGEKTEDKLGARERSGEEGSSKVGGGSSVPVLLPEVQRVTGEEGEKKIVQVRMNDVCMYWIYMLLYVYSRSMQDCMHLMHPITHGKREGEVIFV